MFILQGSDEIAPLTSTTNISKSDNAKHFRHHNVNESNSEVPPQPHSGSANSRVPQPGLNPWDYDVCPDFPNNPQDVKFLLCQ